MNKATSNYFVARDVNGKLYVYEISRPCAATDRRTGSSCTEQVATPDRADGCWTSNLFPGSSVPLRIFNVGYGYCVNLGLQLCDWHGREDPPDEMTGSRLDPFDPARHGLLFGAQHLESYWAGSRPYQPHRRVAEFVTALYRYWDADDRLLYVGISGRLSHRERDHIKASSWMDFAVRSAIERYPSRFQAEDAERRAIATESPLFNSKHNESPEAVRRLVEYLVERGRADLLAPAVSRG